MPNKLTERTLTTTVPTHINVIEDGVVKRSVWSAFIAHFTALFAPLTRTISAAGLASGGGSLAADRTITVTAASQAEAEAGSATGVVLTPQRGKQAIAALAGLRTDTTASYATPYAPDADAHGCHAIIRMTMTGNLTLNVPTNGTAGQRIRYVLTASGAERTITPGSGIKIPNGATFTGAVTSTHVRVIEIEKQTIGWLVVKNQQFTP